ncbi:tyrosinase family protein [Halomonas sp. H33-56]|uniref:tyrosinase family protein n=1 Tax=Halomonas sp. H33-56 TaxID=2950873 RepID=UPI0032DEFC79
MSGQMMYRLPVEAAERVHMRRYIAALGASKARQDNRGFYHYAGIHGAPGRWCWHHQFSPRTSLSARLFLPWHRAYLHRLEQSLQDIDEEVSIPWWDWTGGEGIPEAFDVALIDGEENPLHSSRIQLYPPQVPEPVDLVTERNPGGLLPVFSFPVADVNGDGRATLGEIAAFLVERVDTFEQFNDLIETVHDQLHVYVGATMASTTYAAYDPIFYSHHCMIDRLWSLWQKSHGITNFPPGLEEIVLEPFGLTVGEVLNVQSLGYEYARSVADLTLAGSGLEEA